MKKPNVIKVTNKLSDGTVIKDISKIVIPADHPIYDILADAIQKQILLNTTDPKGA